MGNRQSNRNFKAHRYGRGRVVEVAQMPVDQIWGRWLRSAWHRERASERVPCPALPCPIQHLQLAYVCHVSIVMHGRVGRRSDSQSVGRPIITPNSGLYCPIPGLHRDLEEYALSESLRLLKKLWFRVATVLVSNDFTYNC